MLLLDENFQPGPNDVICGRGKKCYTHIGNVRFRSKVAERLTEYTASRTKDEKSHVVMVVVNEIRRESPYGGFVKQNVSGVWYEVGDFLAREKTSQCFRDRLSDRYKSSTVSRRKKRQAARKSNDPNTHTYVKATPKKEAQLPTSDIMTLVDAALAMSAIKTADATNVSNYNADHTMKKRASLLLPAPQCRRTSNISISQELLTDDIFEFGMDAAWNEADHREHHSLPDAPPSSELNNHPPNYQRATSVPDVPLSSNVRRGSTDSIGIILSFISEDDKIIRSDLCGADDEDASSVSEWDLEPLDAEMPPAQDMFSTLVNGPFPGGVQQFDHQETGKGAGA